MKYSLEWLQLQLDQGYRLKYVFFWGHRPLENGQIGKSCFSQWWQSEFKVDQITYSSAEHWMMAEKARLFQDDEMLQLILQAKSPAEAKKLGRRVRDFDPDTWDQYKYDIVKEGNYHKFSQNEELKQFLLHTYQRILVEASPLDPIWGIGMAADEPGVENPNHWKGSNLLGFALMEVRDQIAVSD